MICLFGSFAVFSTILINNNGWSQSNTLYALGAAFAGGLLTTILVIGLMPFFEVTFGILSALKLVELSNPNHPLLRKLLTETPGTYHHSVMVGNLSEAAAEAIGANGLLCRVGSYYHDIGKTKRPGYFIENQNNIENPHDFIDPKLSKSIIIAHARDGVEMLKDYKLPKPIRDIAEQHHGTTFLHYFHHKALRLAEEQGVEPDFTEADFRYPGPKAQSKEAAVVGIADSVEAAVRSLRKPTVEQVESMIEKIIKSRLDDHQFNECDLTLRELDLVSRTLKETVMGIFHSRIEYPEEIKKTKVNDEKDRGTIIMGLQLAWSNEQELLEIGEELIELLDALLQSAGVAEGVTEGEVALTFVDDEAIHQLNREYRGIDRPTDVLSFAMNESLDEELDIVYELEQGDEMDSPLNMLGDIIISVDRAQMQSEEYGHSLKREIGFLFLHGFLHLLGYDHQDDASEAEMMGKQEAILTQVGLLR